MFNEVADKVIDPQTGVTVKERTYARTIMNADPSARAKLLGNKYMKLSALGAGSDWSGFLQFLGIASLNLGYGGEGSGGEYHSIYDSYDHFTRFKDPGFAYGVTLSKTAGRLMMRLSNAEVLPFEFNQLQKTINEYVEELKTMIDKMRSETETENKLITENIYNLAKDPQKPYKSPDEKDLVPYINFSNLENTMVSLKNSADAFQKLSANAMQASPDKQKEVNQLLFHIEQSLLQADGLPGRKWYKHQIYAPGLYTGYGVKTIPGVREGIEQRNFVQAQENIEIVAGTLNTYVSELNKAIMVIKPNPKP